MANITDQFVTSFSELYFSTTPILDTAVSAEKVVSLAVTLSSAAIGEISVALGNTVFTVDTTASSTVTTVTAALRAAIDSHANYETTSGSGSPVVITGVGAGDFTTTFTAAGGFSGVFTVSTPFAAGTGKIDASEIRAWFDTANLVPLVMEIGTLSNEATVIDTPTFGEVYKGKLRGQLDGGQLDAQLYWAPRNAFHVQLRELSETGVPVYVGIKWNSDSTATDSEYVYFNSFVSSFGIDTTFDDVAKVSMTLVVDGAEHFASDE